MKLKSQAHGAYGPRALLVYAALACLLCSDGVGPRLVPYPTPQNASDACARPAVGVWPSAARRAPGPAPAEAHRWRERALVTLGLKFDAGGSAKKREKDACASASPCAPPRPPAADPASGPPPPSHTALDTRTPGTREWRGPPAFPA